MKMLSRTAGLLVAAGLCVGLANLSAAAGDKKETGGARKLESKSKMAESALTINFAKELELGFPSLTTLGARIEQARQQADPVALAALARELGAAEKVADKTASLKASTLAKEAIEMAKHRLDKNEIKAVALLTGKAKDLAEAVVKAEEKAVKDADDAKARQAGEKGRGIQGRLHADSRVNATIDVFVDGRYVGTMGPFGDIYPWIGQTPWETTYLRAQSRDGRTWHHAVRGPVGDFHWILNP
jgi:hypothetical protein